MGNHRLLRVGKLLQREIGEALRRELPVAEAGVVSVNEVQVAGDLKSARVFISFCGSAEQQRTALRRLEEIRPRVQDLIARSVVLKHTPRLHFEVDDTIARGNRVLQILDDLDKKIPAPRRSEPAPAGSAFHAINPFTALCPARMKIIERILEAIRPCQTFCVVGHVRPDGDCIGSQLGLTLALRNEGRTVACWNEDDVPQKLAFLDPDGQIRKPQKAQSFDCVIATDSASLERLGRVVDFIQNRRLLINIDHHASNTRFGDLNWVSARAPSTGELIYQLLRQARWPITPAMASCLFTAVSTDTGSFQYPTTRPTSYHVAGELVKRGADLEKICQEVYQSFPISRVRLLQRVYNHFHLVHDNRIAYFWLKKADYARTGADKADSEGLIDHLRAIQPVIVACVFEEMEPELTRISLRSKTTTVDVNQIAAQFGGGGHPAAAGARVSGRPLTVQRRVLAAIKAALDAAR